MLPPEPRVTLEQWAALVAVVDAGGYAQAAERLHKSQSAVSYAVDKLETQLGVQAFRIEGRKAVLTPTGQLLYRRARLLLDEAHGLESTARTVSAGWEAQIRIAAEMLFPSWLLLSCLDRFGREAPHTRVEVFETVLAGTEEMLAGGAADLVIAASVPAGHVGIPLVRLRAVLAAHPAHPLHRLDRPLTARDLRAHRQLVIRESSVRRATPPVIEATQRWTVSHVSTSLLAATLGFGYGWFGEEAIRREVADGALAILPLREGGERFAEFNLVVADPENMGPGMRRLVEIIRAGVAEECAAHQKTPPAVQRRVKRSRRRAPV